MATTRKSRGGVNVLEHQKAERIRARQLMMDHDLDPEELAAHELRINHGVRNIGATGFLRLKHQNKMRLSLSEWAAGVIDSYRHDQRQQRKPRIIDGSRTNA